jgi:hypothetical protein
MYMEMRYAVSNNEFFHQIHALTRCFILSGVSCFFPSRITYDDVDYRSGDNQDNVGRKCVLVRREYGKRWH